MTLYELIEDLQALRVRTQAYERKYGVTSHDFYSLYKQGRKCDAERMGGPRHLLSSR